MATLQGVVPCLWFDHEAEEAARYYVAIFKTARVTRVSRYSEIGQEIHRRPPGSVMTVEFELNGTRFTALNGGPAFKFNEALSLQIRCQDQAEVDYYWEKLGEDGDPAAQACGWLKDKYGLSWQVIPEEMLALVEDQATDGGKRAMAAMMKMKKLDLAAIKAAYAGKVPAHSA